MIEERIFDVHTIRLWLDVYATLHRSRGGNVTSAEFEKEVARAIEMARVRTAVRRLMDVYAVSDSRRDKLIGPKLDEEILRVKLELAKIIDGLATLDEHRLEDAELGTAGHVLIETMWLLDNQRWPTPRGPRRGVGRISKAEFIAVWRYYRRQPECPTPNAIATEVVKYIAATSSDGDAPSPRAAYQRAIAFGLLPKK
jgi:hypothetical protein